LSYADFQPRAYFAKFEKVFHMINFKSEIANAIGAALVEFSNGNTSNWEMVDGVEITRKAINTSDWAVEARSYTFWVYQESGVIGTTYEGDIIEALNWAYPIIMTSEFLSTYAPMNKEFPLEIIDHIFAFQEARSYVETTSDISRALHRMNEFAKAGGKEEPSPTLSALIEQILTEDILKAA